MKAIGREVMGTDGVYELREGDVSYIHNFASENSGLRPENRYFGDLSFQISTTFSGPTLKSANILKNSPFQTQVINLG